MKGIKHRNPSQTRNGRIKLFPLGIAQLEQLLEKSVTNKQKGKIRNVLEHKKKIRNKQRE